MCTRLLKGWELNPKLEPWEAYPEVWKSQSAYFTWLRGSLRRIWSTYPAKIVWKKAKLFSPPQSYTGRAKLLGQCHYCRRHFPASSLEVDHVLQAGKCNSWDTSYDFLHSLLDCSNNWVLACKECHKVKSYAERMGISLEDAQLKKNVIAILKKTTKPNLVALALDAGYDPDLLSNDNGRKKFVTWLSSSSPDLFLKVLYG
jgi:5-methylcytosine-specific restriction endonuclease McrA